MKTVVLTALALLAVGAPARAADRVERAKGVVAEHCSRCHEVPGYANPVRSESVDAPRFADIAAAPEVYGEARLHEFLRQPHYPMKGLILSESDIANLIAFIRQLKPE